MMLTPIFLPIFGRCIADILVAYIFLVHPWFWVITNFILQRQYALGGGAAAAADNAVRSRGGAAAAADNAGWL